MADVEYERDEQLLEARRLKRLEMKRKRMIQKRIILGAAALLLIVLIIIIVKSCGKEDAPAEPPAEPPSVPSDNVQLPVTEPEPVLTTATLAAVGDIMVYQSQLDAAKQEDGTYNFLPCFTGSVAETLAGADITVGNLEASLAGPPYAGKPDFRAPEDLPKTLAGLGFDILQTANTYSIQNGTAALANGINVIRGAGMDALGTYLSAEDKLANQVVLKEVNGIRIAFIAFTKGLNNLTIPDGYGYCVDLLYSDYNSNYSVVNRDYITQAVGAAKSLEPDVIVAMVHWGSEYEVKPAATQNEVADLLIQQGVDVILGSHPHVVSTMEQRAVTVDGEEKEVFIAYSLGNFLAAMEREDQTNLRETVVLNLEFTKDESAGKTTISHADYLPVYLFDNGESAASRYELRSVYDVLADEPDDATRQLMENTIATLKANTASSLDRGE